MKRVHVIRAALLIESLDLLRLAKLGKIRATPATRYAQNPATPNCFGMVPPSDIGLPSTPRAKVPAIKRFDVATTMNPNIPSLNTLCHEITESLVWVTSG